MKKISRWVVFAVCIAWLMTLLGCRAFMVDGPGMERQVWQEFTMVRYTYTYEPIYRYTVKCDDTTSDAYLYTNVDNEEKSIQLSSETVAALFNLDILSFPDMKAEDGSFLGFSVTDTKGSVFSKALSGQMETEILELLNPYLDELNAGNEEEPFMLDGPDMEYQSPWTSFSLSRVDSNTQYCFWFTVTDNGDHALVTGECSDKDGHSYLEETGVEISMEDLWQLRWMDFDQLPEDLEMPTDMATISLTVTLSDGTVEVKDASGTLSMEIYELLLPYLKNNN